MIVCFASLMHILWGVLLLINMGGLHITATATFYSLIPNYETRALVYMLSGTLPAILIFKPRWSFLGLAACLPQLVMLLGSGVAAVNAVTIGVYPDGTVVSGNAHLFILMDQGIYIILPLMYAFESLDRFHDQNAKPKNGDSAGRVKQVFLSHAEGDVRVDARVTVQEKGEKGDKGERGETGKTGAPGATGKRGPAGP